MPDFDIHTLDLHFRGQREAIAAFLVIGPGAPVLVETGPGSTLASLEAELAHFGLTPADIGDVLVTHIHLDHAGAAGWWARRGVRVHVHHVGAPHLIDPSRLLASAQRIYGDMLNPLWGEVLPADADRIRPLFDGDTVEAGGLTFTALDTPGHARHHMLYRLDDIAFTGDLAGIRLANRPHVRLPTPPPEFDLEAWRASLARARGQRFARLYLTHFGPLDEVEAHWSAVETLLGECVERVRRDLAAGASRDEVVARFAEWEAARLADAGLDHLNDLYANVGPVGMSADGLIRYWRKRLTPAPSLESGA